MLPAGEPFGIEQGVAAVMLEGNRSDDQYYRRRQRPADPRRFQTTTEPPQRQHGAHQRHAGRQQKEGNEILFFEHFLRSLGGSFSAMTQASDTSARPSSKK